MRVSDGRFAVWNMFQMQIYVYVWLLLYQSSGAGHCQLFDASMCLCFVCERLLECTKSILSGWITTLLKFVLVLNNHSQSVPHCTLFKFSTRQAPSWSSKSLQPVHHMAKGPYVTTLCVLSPFFLCHLASNEHHNGSSLPSMRTQICVPVCFKHLLRPHLAESALGWVAMWFSCLRASSCRQMQSERLLERKRKVGQEMDT